MMMASSWRTALRIVTLLAVVQARSGNVNSEVTRDIMEKPVNAFKLFAHAKGVATRPSTLKHSATAVTPAMRGSSVTMQELNEDTSLIEDVSTAEGGMAARAAAEVVGDDPAKFNAFCYGLPGSTAPLPDFDPAGFSKGKSKREVYRLREAELLHGRVGMVASLGFLVQENFHPLFSGVGGPAINQIPQLPPALWFGMTLGIGICESLRIQKGWADPFEDKANFQQLKEGYYPGDLGFDPLGLKPTSEKALFDMQNRELNNGRLAMIAAAGFLAQEAATGQTWGPNLCELFPEAPFCPGRDFSR
jgi:hypothetical protein